MFLRNHFSHWTVTNNVIRRPNGQFIFFGNLFWHKAPLVIISYFLSRLIAIFRGWMFFSKSIPKRTFCSIRKSLSFDCISCVMKMGSKIKVCRIYTRWIVAFVKNPKSVWNIAIFKNPSNSMRRLNYPILTHLSVPSRFIFGCFSTSHPIPTRFSFFHSLPKVFDISFVNVFNSMFHHASVMLRGLSLIRVFHNMGNITQPLKRVQIFYA